jgi:hypothetical protein
MIVERGLIARLLYESVRRALVDARAAINTGVLVNDGDVIHLYRVLRANIGARAASYTVVCFHGYHFSTSAHIKTASYFNFFSARSVENAGMPLIRSISGRPRSGRVGCKEYNTRSRIRADVRPYAQME